MSYGLDSIVDFKEMPIINKIDIIKNLTEEENIRLNSVTPLHQNDIDKYNIKVDKDLLYRYYSNYKANLEERSKSDSKKAVTTMATNFLKDLYLVEPIETKELINSISCDVFKNKSKIKDSHPLCVTIFDDLNKLYEKSGNAFGFICLEKIDILEMVLGSYFTMRDDKIIKGKTYEKK